MQVKHDDFKPFMAMLTVVADTYGQPRLSEGAAKLYFRVLSGYTLEEVSKAVTEHLKISSFMPKPADIIRILEGTVEDHAAIAWGHVVKAIRQYGHYESVRFDDPAIHYAIDHMGGWQKVCQVLEEELPFRERDFVAHYKRGKNATWNDIPKRFLGKHELHNLQCGRDDMIPETVFIETRREVKRIDAGNNKREVMS